jgi:hypothetical protein
MSTWFTASPVSWITLAITLLGMTYNFGVSHATFNAAIEANRYETKRNREETLEFVKAMQQSIGSLYTSMTAVQSIKTDVEVIKIELKFVRETLGDIKNHQRTNGKSK